MISFTSSPGNVILREMTVKDIPLGMQLKSQAGWNQLEADWKMLLDAGGDNFVASLDGYDVGIVISVPYQDHFTWIAMVLVDPKARRKGVGKTLMNKSIEVARPEGAIRLDATAEGFELYRQLGFQAECELIRLLRTSGDFRNKQKKHSIHPGLQMDDGELASVMELDKPVFGADRSRILGSIYHRNPEYAFYLKENGSIKAYCMGRSGSQYEHIGPMVAEGYAYAADLLEAVIETMEAKDVVIDVFADMPDWIIHLEESGFKRQRSFTRMCLGHLNHPGMPEWQFAIAGPELG
jgi:GNAT superfamily N-acetyltransferase